MSVESAFNEEDIAACLREYDEALASGEKSSVLDGPELPADLRAQLKEDIDCLHLLDGLRQRHAGEPLSDAQLPGTNDEALDRYRLTRLHSVGGIGQVWLAYDIELGREVALKELRLERADDVDLQKRFLREAQITGRLQHPGIVPVYEMVRPTRSATAAEELPFYTMRFVSGRTLTEAVRDYHLQHGARRPGAMEFIALLNAFVNVCNTIAYANARGVIHRDLKGQNVVLGDYGEVIVLDWGLAKVIGVHEGNDVAARLGLNRVEPGPDQTMAGLILGTPAFMAPEQAAGLHESIDQRTDVYGLGAILFGILTDRPPYVGSNNIEILQRSREAKLPRVEDVAPSAPPALAAICAKAMSRRPDDRYPSASALALEIQHWLADEPVLAYREPLPGRLQRWGRRHKPWVTAASAIVATCFLATLGSALLLTEERAKTTALAEEKAGIESQARQNTQHMLYYQQIALADREITAGNINRATRLLDDCWPELRGWEWHCLRRLIHTEPQSLKGHRAAVLALAFSPDNQHLASAGYDRTARIWDLATGRETLCLEGHCDTIFDVATAPTAAGWPLRAGIRKSGSGMPAQARCA
jgi:eukaryotic-like serine/threonine-protein kinase